MRNSLQTPPINLPTAHLQRLSLQDNALTHMPRGSLEGMRALQRLDLSGNNLTTLPRGLFRDLNSLATLLLRGNPWHCGCNLRWLYDWLLARGNAVTVRGLTCHGPERARDLPLVELGAAMEECEAVRGVGGRAGGAGGSADASTTLSPPQGSLFTLRSKRPGLGLPDSGLDYTLGSSGVGRSLALNVKPLSHNSVRVTWSVATPSSSFRLSWLRLGEGGTLGSITETLVRGDRREYLLTALQPRSDYIICMAPLASGPEARGPGGAARGPGAPADGEADEALVCAKAETAEVTPADGGSSEDEGSQRTGALPLAGVVGGATALVFLALVLAAFCWYSRRKGHLSARDHYTRSSARKSKSYGDYIESGTKKDTTILEIRGPGFQMTPLPVGRPPAAKPPREDYMVHTIFPPSNGTGLFKAAAPPPDPGYGTTRGYRDGGVPDTDYCYP